MATNRAKRLRIEGAEYQTVSRCSAMKWASFFGLCPSSSETMNSVAVNGKRITLERVAVNRKAKHQGSSKPAEFAPNATQVLLDRCSCTGEPARARFRCGP